MQPAGMVKVVLVNPMENTVVQQLRAYQQERHLLELQLDIEMIKHYHQQQEKQESKRVDQEGPMLVVVVEEQQSLRRQLNYQERRSQGYYLYPIDWLQYYAHKVDH